MGTMSNQERLDAFLEFLPRWREAVVENTVEADSDFDKEGTRWFGYVCHGHKGLPIGEPFPDEESISILKGAMILEHRLVHNVDGWAHHNGYRAPTSSPEERRASIVEMIDSAISRLIPTPTIGVGVPSALTMR